MWGYALLSHGVRMGLINNGPCGTEHRGGDQLAARARRVGASCWPRPIANRGFGITLRAQLVRQLALPNCASCGPDSVPVISTHRPHVRLRTGRPVSQYAGNEACAELAAAEPHA